MTAPLCVLPHRNSDPQQTQPGALICTWHSRRLTGLNRAIRDNWLDLALIIEPGTAPKDNTPKTRHLKTSSPPAPANLDVLALRDPRNGARIHKSDIPSVPNVIASWVLVLAEERPITTRLPNTVTTQLDLLHTHQPWIEQQPWTDDYWLELTELNTALRAALHDNTHTRIGRCYLPTDNGTCGGDLTRPNGTETVHCQQCRETWVTPQQLARLQIALERTTA